MVELGRDIQRRLRLERCYPIAAVEHGRAEVRIKNLLARLQPIGAFVLEGHRTVDQMDRVGQGVTEALHQPQHHLGKVLEVASGGCLVRCVQRFVCGKDDLPAKRLPARQHLGTE